MKYPARRFLPTIVSLNTLEVISRRGSITAAALELDLTQGAVSRQLLDLESFLGVALFQRGGSSLTLTADGLTYLGKVRPLLDQIESATISISAARQGGNVLHLSLPNTFGLLWVMPRLNKFAQAHPGVQVHVVSHTGKVSLRDAGLDAAVVFSDEGFAVEDADLLHAVQSVPLAAPSLVTGLSLPLPGDQLARMPLLHQITAPNAWAQYLQRWNVLLPVPLAGVRYGLVTFALTAAEAGQGVALIPDYACVSSLATGKTVQLNLSSARTRRGYYLLVSPERKDSQAVAALRKWLTEPAP